ncbi:helix-turn-helix transcriptional regulator [Hamadaea tsunoensis]|uniref:helix-turn-helix transcriptional regulator n=1 Tax=Hamadaea tsunoensis TaxID=53368 RepID=UPI0003F7E67F|nr:LuxR family transcriptional regulator [Hamadaea tsunoensis]
MRGRDEERARLRAVLGDVRAGRSAALVVRGAPGIGKTALLDDLAETAATGLAVLRVTGVPTEAELPYAAAHLLLRPVLDRIDTLPPAQRTAMRGALGLSADAANRFQVGLGVLTLLADLSADRPLLCLVDDAQWLDRESADALLFAVRRLHAEPVAVVFAARDDGGFTETPGLPELHLTGLPADAAEQLLAEHSADLALGVRDQMLREAEGNPLALLELPRSLTPEQRAGGFAALTPAFVEPGTLPSRVLRGFRDRISALPPAARRCLLVTAVAGDDDRPSILAAAAVAGGTLDDFALLEQARLIRTDDARIALWHPLVRVAAQVGADIKERVDAHRALAETAGGDRGLLHRAAATTGVDDELAEALDGVCERADLRAALSIASSTAERAATLSGASVDRFRRLGYAAATALEAGQLERSEELARRAGRHDGDPASIRRLAGVRALLEFERGTPLAAARILVDDAVPAAAGMPDFLASVVARAAVYAWSGPHGSEQLEILDRLAQSAGGPLTGLVAGLRRAAAGDPAAAVADLAAYVDAADDPRVPVPQRLAAAHAALLLGDHRRVRELATVLVADCYRDGRATLLPQPLGLLAVAHQLLGEPEEALAARDEALRIATDTRQHHRRGHLTGLTAWMHAVHGRDEAARTAARQALAASGQRQWASATGWAEHALTILDLQQGRYDSALDRLLAAAGGPARHSVSLQLYTLPDLVEAAGRLGRPEQAGEAAATFTAWAQATRQPWALAVAERCAALLAADPEPHYERALALHAADAYPIEHARTRLLYGEWLRRRQRRAEAAVQLTAADEMFHRLAAAGWQTRAGDELRAAGYAPRSAGDANADPLTALTPQERQVVRLAANGLSNRDIAAQLFLSPRTVGYHLYKAYPKLGVASRADLAAVLIRAEPMT